MSRPTFRFLGKIPVGPSHTYVNIIYVYDVHPHILHIVHYIGRRDKSNVTSSNVPSVKS